jgi:peptide/nickel transport system permease protein
MASFLSFVIKSLVHKFIIFFIVITLIFLIPRLAPGTPIDYLVENPRVPPEVRIELIKKFGLDKPIFPDQYINFLYNFFVRLDLGYSFTYQEPVLKVVSERLVWTLILMGSAIVISIPVGILIGLLLAWRRGSSTGYVLTSLILLTRSFPVFWIGMVLLLIFSFYLKIAPSGGALTPGAVYTNIFSYLEDVLRHLALPLITISSVFIPRYVILMRNASLNVLGEDFVWVAKAVGLSSRHILISYVGKNAILPIMTLISIDIGFIAGGAVVTETVFSYPGVGRLIYEAVLNRDYPLILGAFTIIVGVTLIALTIAELLYAIIDPRVRRGET